MRLVSLVLPFAFISAISFGQGTDPLGSGKLTSYSIASLPDDLIAVDVMTSKDNLMSLMQLSYGGGTISGPSPTHSVLDREMAFQLMSVVWVAKEDVEGKGEFMIGYKLDVPITQRTQMIDVNSIKFRLTYIRRQAIIGLTPREDFSPSTIKELAKGPAPAVAAAADRTRTLSNMKQLSTGVMIFLSDNDDLFAYVQSTPQLFRFVDPYVKNQEIFKTYNPMGGDFHFNMSLAGVSATDVEAPAETPMFFESQAWPDGKRCVSYVDSHAKVVSAEEWAKMQPLLHLKLNRHGKPLKPGDPIPPTTALAPQQTKPPKKQKGGR